MAVEKYLAEKTNGSDNGISERPTHRSLSTWKLMQRKYFVITIGCYVRFWLTWWERLRAMMEYFFFLEQNEMLRASLVRWLRISWMREYFVHESIKCASCLATCWLRVSSGSFPCNTIHSPCVGYVLNHWPEILIGTSRRYNRWVKEKLNTKFPSEVMLDCSQCLRFWDLRQNWKTCDEEELRSTFFIFVLIIDASAMPPFKVGTDPRNDWIKWKRALDRFLQANKIEEDEEKFNLLLVLGGIDLQSYYDKVAKCKKKWEECNGYILDSFMNG